VLALSEILQEAQRQRFGLVTPYLCDGQAAVVTHHARSGFECVAERHVNQSVNFSFSDVEPTQIVQTAREVAGAKPQCITTFCTNLRAAQLAPVLEAEPGIPLHDTVSTAVWKSLRLRGVDTRRVMGWGGPFNEEIA
jgi:maleate isomerase